jgi:hypothetical protein
VKTITITILFLLALAGIAGAQTTPQQFQGTNYGDSPCGPYTTNGIDGCVYGGTIATDPAAARATLYDSSGTTFPPYNPPTTAPPPAVSLSGPWSGYMNWSDGQGLFGTVTIGSGTCYVNGPVFYNSGTIAVYTRNCAGVDTDGNAASMSVKYYTSKGRFGYWQPFQRYYAFNQPSQWPLLAFYVPYPDPPSSNVVGGVDDGSSDH